MLTRCRLTHISTRRYYKYVHCGTAFHQIYGLSYSNSTARYARPTRLEGDEKKAQVALLASSGWKVVDGRDAIFKTFQFADFNEAFGFMSRCALHAERADHHPEWFNVYNRVEVTLTTHDCRGVSQRDIDLALKMDAAASASNRDA